MPPKRNPLKLNKLQLRTLALAQLLVREAAPAPEPAADGAVSLPSPPPAHGDHVHIGRFTVATRAMSGLGNGAVWSALERKGLARVDGPVAIVITAAGLGYDTGFGDRFATSDH